MDIEEDVDDPMEIDDNLPAAAIIERKSDEFSLPSVPSSLEPLTQSVLTEPTKVLKESQKNDQSDDADVVILDDDDEPTKDQSASTNIKSTSSSVPPVKDIIDLVEKPHNSRCLNSACEGINNDFVLAPDFCLSYYRVKRSKSYKEEICKECYSKSIEDFDKLSTELKEGNLILGVTYPIINETLQIEDSDEEDERKEEEVEYIDKESFNFISENIDEIIHETLESVNFENRYELEAAHVRMESKDVEENYNHLSEKVKEIRGILDGIQLNLYNQFRPNYQSFKGMTIIDDLSLAPNTVIKVDASMESSPRKSTRSHKPVSYVELDDVGNSNSPKVNTPSDKSPDLEPPKDLPPILPIDRPPPQVGETYYIVRENSQSSWIRARLQLIIPPGTPHNGITYSTNFYRLIELKQQKERLLSGKSIAYLSFSKVRLPVGTRVISVFKETNNMGETKKPRHDPYYAGIVGEQPFEGNKFRYLIFFDIGYSQYVSYHCVNLVLETSPNVWEDVYVDSRAFIKKYLESQDRPMVKLAKDQTLRVEYKGKWWLCTVMSVDCSLVQVFFDNLSRTEWIYRGSTRLSPMFKEEQAATNRHTGVRTSRKLGHNESATVVQYTRNNDFVPRSQESPTNNVRAVARKSTTRPQGNTPIPNIVPFLPPVNSTPVNITGPTSKIMYFTPREQVIIKRIYRPHTCSPKCKDYLIHNFNQLRGHNPLSKPLLCGWGRMTLKAKGRKEIIYKAPCGRLLRNIAEVHYYLRLTSSEMTVDLFDFNHMVRCLAEFNVECNPDPKDLSRGLEQVAIPVINGINNEMLDFCNYSIKRVPMEGVHMNLETEFLCGCDCDDDCIDKTKCACWKLTLEGAKYIGKDVDPNSVGYIYRRLPDQVITGIYECNSRCKCNSTCLNRVVQNPMSLKLQVFKTHNRGWGIRCLNDVPQGSFICIYAGTLHTEAMANEDGMAYGDEYFAELDYIETVEKFKEDYEAEAMEDEEESRYRGKSPQEEEEDEDQVTPMKQTNAKWKRYNYSEDNDFTPAHPVPNRVKEADSSIRTRLRKRNNDDELKIPITPTENKPEPEIKIKKEFSEQKIDLKAALEKLGDNIETVTISDEEDEGREVLSFNPKASGLDEKTPTYPSVRDLFGEDECVYVMDAKNAGNIGRFLNHSCSPNVFVQNVFVDTHDPRFPWVSFFSSQFIRAGTELTWNYNYDIGSVPGRVLYCHCASLECKGRLL
ncbi:histone-lysine N-methyltransferase eggless [Leptinotarsa decemlineata]|uniref:histone-lysine N-methyltransferase eggless n=1 Tax=Leptinotarsa decemlineata TaxID=7539 RepID=UPI003D30D3A5